MPSKELSLLQFFPLINYGSVISIISTDLSQIYLRGQSYSESNRNYCWNKLSSLFVKEDNSLLSPLQKSDQNKNLRCKNKTLPSIIFYGLPGLGLEQVPNLVPALMEGCFPEVYTSHCDSNNWLANIWLVTWLAPNLTWSDRGTVICDLTCTLKKTCLDLTCNLAVFWLDSNHFQVTESPYLARSSLDIADTIQYNTSLHDLVMMDRSLS